MKLQYYNKEVNIFSPAKINLFLYLYKPKNNNFKYHKLYSISSLINFGDYLNINCQNKQLKDNIKFININYYLNKKLKKKI